MKLDVLKKIIFAATLLMFTSTASRANERRFTYTYESGVLSPGQHEVEFWSTWRGGRANFYSRFDHRVEYEFGVTDRLMSSLYVNWKKISQMDPTDHNSTTTEQSFDGVSSEWKYKLLDPVADALGLALYQEYTFNNDEFEWENKLILDKKIGNTLLAYNATVEPEWEFGPGHRDYEIGVENTLGVTQFLSPKFSAGLELRNYNEIKKDSTGFEHSALFIGPVVSYSHEQWWITATFLKQLPALKKSLENPQDKYVLDEHEKTNIRILVSRRF